MSNKWKRFSTEGSDSAATASPLHGQVAAASPCLQSTSSPQQTQMDTQQFFNVSDVQDISRQMSRTESGLDSCGLDSLDLRKKQIANDQWKLLRAQVEALTGASSDVRAELDTLQANVLDMQSSQLDKLEAFMGEFAERFSSDMGQRLESVESLIRDSAGKIDTHKSGLEQRMELIEGDIHQRLESVEGLLDENRAKHAGMVGNLAATLQERMDLIDENVSRHSSLAATVEGLEAYVADSSEKQSQSLAEQRGALHKMQEGANSKLETWKMQIQVPLTRDMEAANLKLGDLHEDMEAAKFKLGELHDAVTSCAKLGKRMENRIEYVEQLLRESVDKNDSQNTSMQTRITYLDDSVSLHQKEIESAQAKLADLDAVVAACTKREHHSKLEQRLKDLESAGMDESIQKYSEMLQNLYMQQVSEIKQSHAALKSSLEMQVQQISPVLKRIDQAQGEHKSVVEARIKSVESAAKFVEELVYESTNTHSKEIEATGAVTSGLEQRLNYLESTLSESAGKAQQDLADVQMRMKDTFELHQSLVANCSNEAARLHEMENKHVSMEAGVNQHHITLDRRLTSMLETLDTKFALAERMVLEGNENNGRRLSTLEELLRARPQSPPGVDPADPFIGSVLIRKTAYPTLATASVMLPPRHITSPRAITPGPRLASSPSLSSNGSSFGPFVRPLSPSAGIRRTSSLSPPRGATAGKISAPPPPVGSPPPVGPSAVPSSPGVNGMRSLSPRSGSLNAPVTSATKIKPLSRSGSLRVTGESSVQRGAPGSRGSSLRAPVVSSAQVVAAVSRGGSVRSPAGRALAETTGAMVGRAVSETMSGESSAQVTFRSGASSAQVPVMDCGC